MSDTPDNPMQDDNDLVVRGPDGDPLPDPRAVRMVEQESIERVIEGLKMASDACMHLAKQEPQDGQTWKEVGQLIDKMRLEAVRVGGITLAVNETQNVRGNPYAWKKARLRFLDGLKQATGGMRQLATCFRADYRWSILAQELERREQAFRALLIGRKPHPMRSLILPPGFVRH